MIGAWKRNSLRMFYQVPMKKFMTFFSDCSLIYGVDACVRIVHQQSDLRDRKSVV